MSIIQELKHLVSFLPSVWQSELKRFHYRRQIQKGTFKSEEPEYELLDTFIKPGSWIIDVGANIGHYTRRFSELVGPEGRVIAFEPVPETFVHLAENLKEAKCTNVSLVNAAASDNSNTASMDIPSLETGLKNFYQAHLTTNPTLDGIIVLILRIDSLAIPHRVSLVKIDAEGHELAVLNGMLEVIQRDYPVLIVETGTKEVVELLTSFGYSNEHLQGSPNKIFRHDN